MVLFGYFPGFGKNKRKQKSNPKFDRKKNPTERNIQGKITHEIKTPPDCQRDVASIK